MRKKRVLLYASTFMNIYQDVLKQLEDMNYDVLWIEANTIPNNPFNRILNLYSEENIENYILQCTQKWIQLLKSPKFSDSIDIFFSIEGMDIPPFAIEELSKRNPGIQKILYMYDRVEGIYQIDRFFKYYDKIFSFDISDCKRYNLKLLPIYWIPVLNNSLEKHYDIFAFASYSIFKIERTLLFRKLKKLACKKNYKAFIKLYDYEYGVNKIKFIARNILRFLLKRNHLSFLDYYNGLITGETISPDKYRQLIFSSNVIIDTNASYQDGLTARFMWALGLGKKIITTNEHIRLYEFYDKDQIFIINESNFNDIDAFIQRKYIMNNSQKKKLEPYRIDNWVNTIFE